MKFVLIGGRSIANLNNFELESNVFKHLNISNPNILFIPQAAYKDIYSSINKFKNLTKEYKGQIEYLIDLEESNIDRLFDWADVIYVGGGSATNLVRIANESPLSKYIYKYINSDKLYIGVSAGAMLVSKYAMGDEYIYTNNYHIYNYQMVDCLGILDFIICPHYDHDGLDCFNDEVKKYNLNAYALEDDTAILVDETIKVFKIDKRKSVYLFDKENDYQMIPLYGD
jgi:dipeptidase E